MNKQIIGYFHICQKDGWQKSFDIIFNQIKHSGLYDATSEIRIGIVNDVGYVIDDERLHHPKFKIVLCNNSSEYERSTLYHMKNSADNDQEEKCYYYVHSKGIQHWGKWNESCILDWINFLLYWNIKKWRLALKILEKYDTYGCNAIGRQHYSGNFWWANSNHIKQLPSYIPEYYTAPEDWICIKHDKMFNIYSSGLQGCLHYSHNLPESEYSIPEDFDLDAYYNLNPDFHNVLSYEDLTWHYIKQGKYEIRKYKYDN